MITKKKILRITLLTMLLFFFLLLKGYLVEIPFGTHQGGIITMKYGGIILFMGIISGILIKKYYPETSE
ncbi:hypothetical protein [uncultured Polaribacter sp.]|uniref:hypothetical protein n=1 Tax=uncultured Polaribacter sp. TaxID=174711 RepID=UPI0026282E90|nr:hypothetical protein [uncultured Polaribacter sp.]